MSNPMKGWEAIETEIEIPIPTLDGKAIAEKVTVKLPALRNPRDGEVYLDGEALKKLDDVKARHMGLMLPAEIKALREGLGLTQKQVSMLLQIGEKTWTRWESGRERPSRSMNVLLNALYDRKINLFYLKSLCPLNAKKELLAGWEEEPRELASYDLTDHASYEGLAEAA